VAVVGNEPEQAFEQGGFAGAVGSEQADDLTLDLGIEPGQRLDLAIPLAHMAELDEHARVLARPAPARNPVVPQSRAASSSRAWAMALSLRWPAGKLSYRATTSARAVRSASLSPRAL